MDGDVLQPSNIQRQQIPIWHMFRIVHAYIQPGEPEIRPRYQQVLGVLQRLGQLFGDGHRPGYPRNQPTHIKAIQDGDRNNDQEKRGTGCVMHF